MNRINPFTLNVMYSPPATEFKPVEGRKYSFAKTNKPGEANLYIGYEYNRFSPHQIVGEEIRAEWIPQLGQFVLCGKTPIFYENNEEDSQIKLKFIMSQQEIHEALTAIIYGDRAFFFNYPWLLDSPIYIHYQTQTADYNKMIYFGTPRQYLNEVVAETKS